MYNLQFEPPMDPLEPDEVYAYDEVCAYNDRQAYYDRYYDEEGDV